MTGDTWQDLIDRLLPPGYRVLNDGPGREVLSHESWEHGVVYGNVSEAIDAAREDARRRTDELEAQHGPEERPDWSQIQRS